MPFKSEKSSRSDFSLKSYFWESAALALCLVASGAARATMTVNAVNGGINQPANSTAPINVYYSVTNSAGGPLAANNLVTGTYKHFIDSGDSAFAFAGIYPHQTVLVPGTTTPTADSRGNLRATNMLMFDVHSSIANPTVPAGSTLAVVVNLFQSGNLTTSKIAPIAWVGDQNNNGSDCLGSGNCYSAGGPNTNHLYAVAYSATGTIRIGLYPEDMCADFSPTAATFGSGCNPSGTVSPNFGPAPAAQTPSQMVIQVALYALTATNAAPSGSPLDSINVGLNFTSTPLGVTSCAALAQSKPPYTPGDGSITVSTGLFGPGAQRAALDPPITTLIAVGKDEGSTSSFASAPPANVDLSSSLSDDIVQRITLGNAGLIGGFTNTTGSDHNYYLAFLLRDASGLVSLPDPSNCALQGVKTSAIFGFLKKSRCFIATAAFRSMDAAPVEMLREFREKILLTNRFGQSFVDWYYSWSPAAAEWLLDHPVLEIPALTALLPLEVIAWVLLKPIFAFGLAGLGLLLIFASSIKRRSTL